MSTSRTAVLPALTRPFAYVALTKPDVTFLVLITTLAGFYMGAPGSIAGVLLLNTLLGTTLVGAGTSALNHYIERASDAKMRRTAGRPLPLGLLQPKEALIFGLGFVLIGAAYLAVLVNGLSSFLALATCVSYLGIYTPLKKLTPMSTTIGAIPGAIPPLIGWAAARGSLSPHAWILFAILFLWQFPHFLAIAWMYREDYARGGIRMLPVLDPSGRATFRQVIGTAALLVPVSLLPSVVGLTGIRYFFGALLMGMALVQMCLWAEREKTNSRAKWLMHATVLHIPLLLALMMFDKISR
jgi:protoheme IX farnesyltransferase